MKKAEKVRRAAIAWIETEARILRAYLRSERSLREAGEKRVWELEERCRFLDTVASTFRRESVDGFLMMEDERQALAARIEGAPR